MADEVDLANEQADLWLNRALATAAATTPRLPPKGECHYCGEVFDPKAPDTGKKLFCDADCSADYEREQRLKGQR